MATQSNQSMVSETSICNQSLTWLGQDPVNSINDGSTTAEWMRNNYPFLRDAVLESAAWTFATTRAVSTTEDMDPWGVMYTHPIPLNWRSVLRVYRSVDGNGNGVPDRTWCMEGGNVLSTNQTVYLWGIQQVTDTNKFSMLFVQALAARIAADACIPMTEDRILQKDMWNLLSVKLDEAKAGDGIQGANETIQSNSLINARAGGGY